MAAAEVELHFPKVGGAAAVRPRRACMQAAGHRRIGQGRSARCFRLLILSFIVHVMTCLT